MSLRHGMVLSVGLVLAAAPVLGETLPLPPRPPAAGTTAGAPVRLAQVQTKAPAAVSAAAPMRETLPRTLTEALAATYANQPALQAERAKLRATDENVPQALAGWRPTVVLGSTVGYGDGMSRTYSGTAHTILNAQTDRLVGTAQATVTQNLYTGGKTQANVNRAKNQVMGERALLLAQEQTSFTNAVNAYIGVIQARQLLELNANNEQVLAKQLQATNDRFRVGEITRTDVAQAEAALASARSQRQTADANLQTARGTFRQVIGYDAPADLIAPQPLDLPVHNESEASAVASINNPNVISALFNDAAAKDAVDVAFAALLPQVSVQGQTFQQNNSGGRGSTANGYQVVAQLSVPVYQGGQEYSAVRQARQNQQQSQRQVDDARRTAVQNAVQAWATLVGARAAADSTRSAIRANEIALEGVEREAIVGSRTTLDVLNAQQALLNSRTTLVQNLAQLVTASFQVAAAIGRLTARDMHLPVALYDETAYYNAVRDRWIGLGDYATSQPSR